MKTAGLLVLAGCATRVVAQQAWLQPLAFTPVAVSGNGEYVIGSVEGAGFRWSRAGGQEPLLDDSGSPLEPRFTNIDGTAILCGSRFVWREGEPGAILLSSGSFPDISTNHMSSSGWIIGRTGRGTWNPAPCRWGSNGGFPGFYPITPSTTGYASGFLISPDGDTALIIDFSGSYLLITGYDTRPYNPSVNGRDMADGGIVVGSMFVGGVQFAVMADSTIVDNLGIIGQEPRYAAAVTPDARLAVCSEGFIWEKSFGVTLLRPLLEREGIQFASAEPIDVLDVSDDRRTFVGTGGGLVGWVARIPAVCYANCDGSTAAPVFNAADFTCFLNKFAAGSTDANCDDSTQPPVLNVADFTCFLQRFSQGCP